MLPQSQPLDSKLSSRIRSEHKGQLISKGIFGVIVWTKKTTKIFKDFCPSLLKEVGSKKIKALHITN